MGGALLQQIDRDTQKFAMKCSAAKVDNEWRDVFKDPITDPGKTSKKGVIELFMNRNTGEFKTMRVDEATDEWINMMDDVFVDGELLREQMFPEVRATVQEYFEATMA